MSRNVKVSLLQSCLNRNQTLEKIAHVSGKARHKNSPIGWDHQRVHSKDHHAPMHPKEAFRNTTYDLRKDNNIKVLNIYRPWSSRHYRITILKAKMDKIPICTLVTNNKNHRKFYR